MIIDDETYTATRRSLHGVAELLIAGPQYRSVGTIRLRILRGGFGGVRLRVSVRSGSLFWPGGEDRIDGATCRELAAGAGIDAGRVDDLYADTSGVELDDRLPVDAESASLIGRWFTTGDEALQAFAPGATPVLWPEHFDLAVSVDEVNYGVSPGDAFHATPYAYVGPWQPREGDFWNAPFGAVRPASQFRTAAALAAFFLEAGDHL